MKALISTSLLALTFLFTMPKVHADIQPAELVAGGIRLSDGFVIAEIYCGGTYGQTYPGGRIATLEVREGRFTPFRVLWRGALPDIGKDRFYITRPYGSPVKIPTTFRLTISPGDRNPANDVATRTFNPIRYTVDRPHASPKLRAEDKIKLFP
ncbi:MAG: hypothetical protein U0793_31115 [Gemmataceae bacterium]